MPVVLPRLLDLDPAAIRFEPFRAGVEIARLSGDGEKGETALLRYAPGACVPLHEHTGLETILVLSGAQSDDAGTYRAGDLVLNEPGSRHRVWSDEGCLVLISWAAPVRILEDEG
ncbi:cupin domain-containing protein [Jiella sonneratiae]|uniref:Cupin domain-containing protein n=1 Tax=Jiella sonneratiae TaxID=2816856 RepID=A0ABS3J917_9HYPH|nr:cupin domain-containing protein [Jiella sonneratiae]MBO0906166.1 cupin domain-containing protein [Jiella sonneratiae]